MKNSKKSAIYNELVKATYYSKHHNREELAKVFNGVILPYYDKATDPTNGYTLEELLWTLSIVCCSCYSIINN